MASLGVALVTGAGQGIGRAIALRLAKDGFDIALNDLPSSLPKIEAIKADIITLGRKVALVPADVTSDSGVREMIDSVVKDLGSLDVMVANAGIVRSTPLLQTDVEQWDEVLKTNGRSTFLCYKYAAKQMIAQGHGGRIIGASSLAGKQGNPLLASYSASKFAVRGLTHSAATELAPFGITVNAYAPSIIETHMKFQLGDAFGDPEAYNEAALSRVPLGRFGQPDEVASLVSFIASKDSGYITGQSISINGGAFGD